MRSEAALFPGPSRHCIHTHSKQLCRPGVRRRIRAAAWLSRCPGLGYTSRSFPSAPGLCGPPRLAPRRRCTSPTLQEPRHHLPITSLSSVPTNLCFRLQSQLKPRSQPAALTSLLEEGELGGPCQLSPQKTLQACRPCGHPQRASGVPEASSTPTSSDRAAWRCHARNNI